MLNTLEALMVVALISANLFCLFIFKTRGSPLLIKSKKPDLKTFKYIESLRSEKNSTNRDSGDFFDYIMSDEKSDAKICEILKEVKISGENKYDY